MSEFDRAAGDEAGAETLEIMAAAPKYNRWMYDAIAPWLGRRVLEIGSGTKKTKGDSQSAAAMVANECLSAKRRLRIPDI